MEAECFSEMKILICKAPRCHNSEARSLKKVPSLFSTRVRAVSIARENQCTVTILYTDYSDWEASGKEAQNTPVAPWQWFFTRSKYYCHFRAEHSRIATHSGSIQSRLGIKTLLFIVTSEGFWWWYITLEVSELFGFCPSYYILNNTAFRKLDLFPSSGEMVGGIYSVGPIRKIEKQEN
jgi:hypothetical protein